MALTDILRDRAARKGGTAQVDCGELGRLTVEALPPADCARLADDSRSLLYAACRELQMAGEALRSEGKIFRPDEITAYVTADEAEAAARTILELSGISDADLSGMEGLSEIRHQSVQTFGDEISEIRHQSVQTPAGDFGNAGTDWTNGQGIRLSSVQGFSGLVKENGQVSREFSGDGAAAGDQIPTDKKAQILGEMSSRTAQILVSEKGGKDKSQFSAAGTTVGLHETESDLQRQGRGHLHETESELRRSRLQNLHETTSDFGGRRGILLHETESESAQVMHEIKSELQKGLHEIKSEVREMLHEIESELPEAAAQRLAEALLRAGQVR